ncbi:MAG: MFS transporter [Dehalococcoidia bacterium]
MAVDPSATTAESAGVVAARKEGWFTRTSSAMRDPHYRNFYIGNVMQFGSMNMQLVVRGWLVFHITGSFAALGTMSLANAIPTLIFSPIGGVVADRMPKKTIIQAGQIYNAINAALLAILAAGMFGMQLEFWHLFLSAFLQGMVNSVMQPSRQSFISDIVPRERLTNAIGLNATAQTFMQLTAPGLAGFMIAAYSPAIVFWTMAAMYVVAVAFTMRLPKNPLYAFVRSGAGHGGGHGRAPSGFADLVEGFRYVIHDPVIRMVIAVNFLIVIVAMPYTMLLPGFVQSILHKGAFEQGVLQSMQGVGALGGAMFVASAAATGRGRMFLVCGAILGVGILAFSLSTNYWISLPIMIFIGAGQTGRMALGQVLIQSYSEEQYRGRVMSVWFMEFGLVQFGTFIVGLLAEAFGAQIAIGGLAAVLVLAIAYLGVFGKQMKALD